MDIKRFPRRYFIGGLAFALCLAAVGFNAVRAPDFPFPQREYHPYELAGPQAAESAPVTGKVNINTADAAQLQTLPGIGAVTAQRIVDYRGEHGRFTSRRDLMRVKGIGEKTYEKLKDKITL